MGLGTSAATILILIGIAGAIAIAYPGIESGITKISGAFGEQAAGHAALQQTSIAIDSVDLETNLLTCGDYNMTIMLRNSGSVSVVRGKLSIFDNGAVLNNTMAAIVPPGKTINIRYEDMRSGIRDHRVFVVAENGVSAYGEYTLSDRCTG